MDHTRDNPLKRFTAFWITLLLVFCFGVALIILRPLTHSKAQTAYDLKSESKLEVKEEVDRAQESALNQAALKKAMAAQVSSFKQNVVAPGSMPVPGAAPAAAPAPAETPAEAPVETSAQ